MKIAVSIPDPTFKAAEDLAHRLKLTRSELYARALEQYLNAQADQDVTEQLNRLYDQQPSALDPDLKRTARRTLRAAEWE